MEKPDRYLKLDDVLTIIDEMIEEENATMKAWDEEQDRHEAEGDRESAEQAWRNAMKHYCIVRTLEKLRVRLD